MHGYEIRNGNAMKLLDRICGWILIVGAVVHGTGSYLGYRNEPTTLLWSLCASQAALLAAVINLLRAGEDPRTGPLRGSHWLGA